MERAERLTSQSPDDVDRFFELAIAEERRARWRRVARLVLELLRLLGPDGSALAHDVNARLGRPLNGGDMEWFRYVVSLDDTPHAIAAWAAPKDSQ